MLDSKELVVLFFGVKIIHQNVLAAANNLAVASEALDRKNFLFTVAVAILLNHSHVGLIVLDGCRQVFGGSVLQVSFLLL